MLLQLQDIKNVVHLTESSELNRYLKNGWILINSYTVHSGHPDHKDDYILVYSVGAPEGVDIPSKKS